METQAIKRNFTTIKAKYKEKKEIRNVYKNHYPISRTGEATVHDEAPVCVENGDDAKSGNLVTFESYKCGVRRSIFDLSLLFGR